MRPTALKQGLDTGELPPAAHVQRELGIARKGIEELDGQLGIKGAHTPVGTGNS